MYYILWLKKIFFYGFGKKYGFCEAYMYHLSVIVSLKVNLKKKKIHKMLEIVQMALSRDLYSKFRFLLVIKIIHSIKILFSRLSSQNVTFQSLYKCFNKRSIFENAKESA